MTTEKFRMLDWGEAAEVHQVLHHFKYGYSRLEEPATDALFDELALIIAQASRNPDTKEALRRLLEVRDLYRRTRERLIGE